MSTQAIAKREMIQQVAAQPSTASSNPPSATPRRQGRALLRRILLPAGLAVLAVGAIVGYGMYRDGQRYVSTDNAQLSGTPIQVGAMNAGRVVAVTPSVGSFVHRGDVLAEVALPSQVGIAQNGQAKLGFIGPADTRVEVEAPEDGTVIAVPGAVGATVAAGQPIVTLVDPRQLWVSANIDETSISRVRLGQRVTIHVDALNADLPGQVEAITPATAASFSLLPQANTTGTFTKVTQLVPVRIAANLGDAPTLLGSSVEVKIRVAD